MSITSSFDGPKERGALTKLAMGHKSADTGQLDLERRRSAAEQQRAAWSVGRSPRVISGGATVTMEAVLGHVAHWLDLLATHRSCQSGGGLLRFMWCRQPIWDDRLWGSPENIVPEETNNIVAQLDVDEHSRWEVCPPKQHTDLGNHPRVSGREREPSYTCYVGGEQLAAFWAAQQSRSTCGAPCSVPVSSCTPKCCTNFCGSPGRKNDFNAYVS